MLTAYSYARYSSTAQVQGDSELRQIEAARAYATDKGFALDESLGVDRGLSGFTGDNPAKGVLGSFLSAVSAGRVKRGSVLTSAPFKQLVKRAGVQGRYLFFAK